MLWIRDILLWIQICGSVPLATDPDSDPNLDLDPDPTPDSDPDPTLAQDPGIFVSDLQENVINKSKYSRNLGFSYYFCLIIEGSGAGYVSHTNGSGFGWIRIFWLSWIRIRIGNPDPDPVQATDIIIYDFHCTSIRPFAL